jgi:hypothetical protein
MEGAAYEVRLAGSVAVAACMGAHAQAQRLQHVADEVAGCGCARTRVPPGFYVMSVQAMAALLASSSCVSALISLCSDGAIPSVCHHASNQCTCP